MNASQLTLIKEAKRLLEDCACFQGPAGPQGATGATGPQGPIGPAGTITDFTIPGASTNSLMYYTGVGFGAMSSLFYYSSINTLSANLDIVPCTDLTYNLGSSNLRFNSINASNYNGIENYNYISTSQLTSTVSGLGNIYISSIIQNSFGKVLRVDSVYGNDTIAKLNQYSYPFSTISTAMSVASTNDCIYLLPGNYNEKVTYRAGVNIRGVSLNSVNIYQSNVTSNTTLVTMASNTRLEDVTLNLTSTNPSASNLIGVLFSSCQGTAKIRAMVINVNNSGLTANSNPTNLYGIYSAGYSSTIITSFDEVQRTSITVTGAGSGNKRCLYSDNSNRFSMRDINFLVTDAMNATYTGGSYIGVETVNSNSVVFIKASSVNGNAYNASNNSADISQTDGNIYIGFTDLVNRNANNLSFTPLSDTSYITFGVNGILSNLINITAGKGYYWNNSFLVPGSISFSDFVGTASMLPYFPVRNDHKSLIYNMGITSATSAGDSISTTAILYKNSNVVPHFSITLYGNETVKYLSTSSITLQANDTWSVYLSTSQSNTLMTFPKIQFDLY